MTFWWCLVETIQTRGTDERGEGQRVNGRGTVRHNRCVESRESGQAGIPQLPLKNTTAELFELKTRYVRIADSNKAV